VDSLVLRTEVEGGVLLTLNRPERMNAVSMGLLDQLRELLDEVESDPAIRTVIVTGAGDRAFCAGADLKERKGMSDVQVRNFLAGLRRAFTQLESMPKATIAMVNGVALGGGCELALACDIRVMADNASMGLTETRLAIIPGAGGTQRLSRLVGKGRAKEMIFTARRVGAAEAFQIGLCEKVAQPGELRATALELAREIALAGPIAIVKAKFAIEKGSEVDLSTGLDIEGKAYEVLLPSEDRQEALRAFAEKRLPHFQGR